MTLTDTAARELAAQDCATPWLVLLEISHPQLPAPLRLTSDGVATISNGASYEPFPFEVTLPDDAEGRAPLNYAVFLGSDASYGEGARPIEDVLVYANTIIDLVTADQYGSDSYVDTAIIVSQFSATPHNVVIRGNTLAQRTATGGLTWSQLKLRGIEGENRQWRRDLATGSMLWYDPTLSEEIFLGQGKAIRVEAPNGLDRLTYDIDDNRFDGFSDDDFLRSQPMWDGTQSWAVPLASTEFPVGAPARATGIDLRGYRRIRLVVSVGTAGGLADTVLSLFYSVDGGVIWADSGAGVALTGAGDETNWGGWTDIPDALRQSIDVQLAVFGSNGNGSTTATILSIAVDVKNVDQTSAARLLPMQVLPAEKLAADGTALRSYSVQDIADIGFAATAGADRPHRHRLHPGVGRQPPSRRGRQRRRDHRDRAD